MFDFFYSKKKIKNFEKKLEGKLPVTKEELFILVNSWGRTQDIDINNEIFDFKYKTSFSKNYYDLSKLDTSQITNMFFIFAHSNFNGDISNWDVSNVTSMDSMFWNSKIFNQDISQWDVSNVTSMLEMFYRAESFNQNISNWNTSNVKTMNSMFANAKGFNQPIGSWDVSNVTNMNWMFLEAESFEQPILFEVNEKCYLKWMFKKTSYFINKFNEGIPLPEDSNDIKEWLNDNREKMNDFDLKYKHGEVLDNFFSKLQLLVINNKDR